MIIIKEYLRGLLIGSMPYRNAYSPTIEGFILFYILPVALGLLVCRPYARRLSDLKNIPVSTLCSLSLITAFFFNLPWLIFFLDDLSKDIYLFRAVAYLFLIVPVLVMIGVSLNLIDNKWQAPAAIKTTKAKKYISYFILVLLMTLTGLLNSIPVILSDYPVGADVYFHIAATNHIGINDDLLNDPRFYEETNPFYPPLFLLMIAKVSEITHISIIDLWRYYPVIISPVFIFFVFYFVKLITGDYITSVMSVLFVFPWNQILWFDHSPKLFAWCFLIIMLIFWYRFFKEKKIIYLIFSILCFIIIWLTHIEIAVHGGIILGAYLTMKYLENAAWFTAGIRKVLPARHQKTYNFPGYAEYDPNIDDREFSLLLLLYMGVFLYFMSFIRYYNAGDLLVFNEIALSTFSPIGPITFLVFLLIPIGLLKVKDSRTDHIMILSIVFLYSSVFFYFTLMWKFYHHYFSETAYIGFAILSGRIVADQINQKNNLARIIGYVIIILLVFSLIPKYEFVESYSPQVQERIEPVINIIEDIKNIEDDSAVILADPSDIINRYIPAMTGKYIFAASIESDKNQQWQVISVPNFMVNRVQRRVDLANTFLDNPDIEILKRIKSEYKVTHILLKQYKYNDLNHGIIENSTIIAKNDGYVLLKIDI